MSRVPATRWARSREGECPSRCSGAPCSTPIGASRRRSRGCPSPSTCPGVRTSALVIACGSPGTSSVARPSPRSDARCAGRSQPTAFKRYKAFFSQSSTSNWAQQATIATMAMSDEFRAPLDYANSFLNIDPQEMRILTALVTSRLERSRSHVDVAANVSIANIIARRYLDGTLASSPGSKVSGTPISHVREYCGNSALPQSASPGADAFTLGEYIFYTRAACPDATGTHTQAEVLASRSHEYVHVMEFQELLVPSRCSTTSISRTTCTMAARLGISTNHPPTCGLLGRGYTRSRRGTTSTPPASPAAGDLRNGPSIVRPSTAGGIGSTAVHGGRRSVDPSRARGRGPAHVACRHAGGSRGAGGRAIRPVGHAFPGWPIVAARRGTARTAGQDRSRIHDVQGRFVRAALGRRVSRQLRLSSLATTDGLSWQRIAPDLMAKAGIWGVGIVSLADQPRRGGGDRG